MSTAHPIPPPTEIDANGHPIYRFPPFPKAPPGMTIIPFKDFKPAGIQLPALGFPDGIERDGLGIPTIALPKKVDDNEHVPGSSKKKKRKGKNRKQAGGGGQVGGRRMPWWEEWALDEHTRGAREVDPLLPARDRYAQADNDFTQGRRMSSETQSIHDHFALFTGLLGRNLQAPQSRHAKELIRDAELAENDYDSDDGLPDMSHVAVNAKAAKVEDDANADSDFDKASEGDKMPEPFSEEVDPEDAEAFQRQVEEEEDSIADRMTAFFEDPVFSMKVFLSSHFRDKGLIWSPVKLEQAPKLLDFFLAFLIRNNVLPELNPKLRMAQQIVELAKTELPATAKIGYNTPDGFAKACKSTWGAQQGLFDPRAREEAEKLEAETVALFHKDRKDGVIELMTEGVQKEEPVGAKLLDTNVNKGGWGIELEEDEAINGWGTTNGWGSSGEGEEGANPWIQAEEDVRRAWEVAESMAWQSFISCLGPVPIERSFVHQYRLAIAEDSLRSIEKIYEPGELVLSEATWENERLSVVILKPWFKPEDSQLRDASVCEILAPGDDSPKPKPNEITPEKDSRKKRIRALVAPDVAKFFVTGMVLGGVFVKMVQITADKDQKPKEWWYIEKVVQTLPSYYEELNTAYINNLVQLS